MRADEFEGGYYSPEDDKFNQAQLSDTRRTRITRAAKDLEDLVHADHLEIQYAPPAEGAPGL